MNLHAYLQIDDLDHFLKENKIEIPRLRGIEAMADYTVPLKINKDDISCLEQKCVDDLCTAVPFWSTNPDYYDSTPSSTNMIANLCEGGHIRFDRIHGKKKRVLKTYIHNEKRKYIKQIDTFNKYIGRSDVLKVHARIGGCNWIPFGGVEIARQPWFIEKVDDAFDDTYCDIYVKIGKSNNP
jgi:hypothetical protein